MEKRPSPEGRHTRKVLDELFGSPFSREKLVEVFNVWLLRTNDKGSNYARLEVEAIRRGKTSSNLLEEMLTDVLDAYTHGRFYRPEW